MKLELLLVVASILEITYVASQDDPFADQYDIDSIEFKRRIDEGFFASIIDVRSAAEFQGGHIENATLIESLASFGTSSQIATPNDLMGCESCDLGIYCNSGTRAGQAIVILKANGFRGRLYNGQGVVQWTNEGYPLVTGPSTPAPCATTVQGKEMCELSYLARTQMVEGGTPPSMNGGMEDPNDVEDTATNGGQETDPNEMDDPDQKEDTTDVSASNTKEQWLFVSILVATVLSLYV